MLDPLPRALPPVLLLGLMAYAAVTALWLQPVVEQRLAERTYIPLCEAHLRENKDIADAETRAAQDRQRQSLDILRQLERDFGMPLPGMGYFDDVLEQTILPPSSKKARSLVASPCGCAAGAAFDAIKLNMLLHVMSARLYRPGALETLPASVLHEAIKVPCTTIGGN